MAIGGFQVELVLNADVSEKFLFISFLKYHMHYIFLEKSEKFRLRSASFINDNRQKRKSFT